MIKGFIFDLDGVITDTAEYHYLAWKQLSDEKGWEFSRELNEQLRGVSRLDSLQIILDHNNVKLTQEEKEKFANLKNSYYTALLERITPKDLLPGVKEFLLTLRKNNIKTSIASASKNARVVLEKLQAIELFDNISDGNSVFNSKPAPDIFIHAAGSLGCKVNECVVVEDAEAGIKAAIIAGMRTIGVNPIEELKEATLKYKGIYQIEFEEMLKKLENI